MRKLISATLMSLVMIVTTPAYTEAPRELQFDRPVSTIASDIELDWQFVDAENWIKVTASWYGPGFHGEQRADGQGTYDMYDYSAAHVSLPFGTVLRVYNSESDVWVDVVINDSGPYNPYFLPPYQPEVELRPHPGRQLDLSWAAAHDLGILEKGVAELWVVGSPGHTGPLVLDDLYADASMAGNLRH